MATKYVRTDGNDANDGSANDAAHAWLTWAHGLATMAGGDTLTVGAGSFPEGNLWMAPAGSQVIKSGAAGSPTRIVGAGAGVTTLAGNFYLRTLDYVEFEDFTIDAAGYTNGIGLAGGNDTINFTDIELKNADDSNFLTGTAGGPITNITWTGGSNHDSGLGGPSPGAPSHGFYFTTAGPYPDGISGVIIDGPEIYNHQADVNSFGITLYDSGTANLSDFTIRNYDLHDCSHGVQMGSGPNHLTYNFLIYDIDQGPGIEVGFGYSADCRIVNGYIDNVSADDAIQIAAFGTAINVEITNVIIANCVTYAVHAYGGSGHILSNSILYNNGATVTGSVTQVGILTSDPLVVGSPNFHPTSTSPSILAGLDRNSYFTTDADGATRGPIFDIGPYQFTPWLPVTPDPGPDPTPAEPNGINASPAYLAQHFLLSRCPIYQIRISQRNGTTVVTEPSAYWKLDEVEGSRVDSIGTAHLTDNHTVTYIATGKIKRSAQFSRANLEYLSAVDQAALRAGARDFSWAGWVKLDAITAGEHHWIASKSGTSAGLREWTLDYDNTGTPRFTFTIYNNSGSSSKSVVASAFGAASIDTWYFVVIRHTTSSKTIGISVNGGTENTDVYTTTNANASTGSFYLGADGSNAVSQNWDGQLDEVGWWGGYRLTNGEIASLYNSGSGLPLKDYTTDLEIETFSTAWPITREDLGAEILIPIELNRRVEIDRCRLPLSTFTFLLQDIGSAATTIISAGIVGYKLDLFAGFYHIAWTATPVNYVQLFSGTIAELEYESGSWRVIARSALSAASEKTIFNGASSQLVGAIGPTDTSLTLKDASAFETALDLPQKARKVIMIDDELMVYRAKSGDVLSSIQRPGSVGYAVPPRAGPAASHSDGAFVRELVKLGNVDNQTDQSGVWATDEMHPMEEMKTLFVEEGKSGFGEAHIDYNEAELDQAKADLGTALQFRFVHEAPSNAKRFMEEEIYLPLAGYPTENNIGETGIKLYAAEVTFSPSVQYEIEDEDILDFPKWLRNAEKIINVVIDHYDYMPTMREYQAQYIYKDQALIDSLGRESVLEIFSKGIRSPFQNIAGTQTWFQATDAFLLARAQAFIQRFGNESPIIGVTTVMQLNLLQCSDEVRCSFSHAINLGTAARFITDEPFEVSAMRIDFVRNLIDFELLGFPP